MLRDLRALRYDTYPDSIVTSVVDMWKDFLRRLKGDADINVADGLILEVFIQDGAYLIEYARVSSGGTSADWISSSISDSMSSREFLGLLGEMCVSPHPDIARPLQRLLGTAEFWELGTFKSEWFSANVEKVTLRSCLP